MAGTGEAHSQLADPLSSGLSQPEGWLAAKNG
jgi:hypothetical protein